MEVLMGKSAINGPFSMAMLVTTRGYLVNVYITNWKDPPCY